MACDVWRGGKRGRARCRVSYVCASKCVHLPQMTCGLSNLSRPVPKKPRAYGTRQHTINRTRFVLITPIG